MAIGTPTFCGGDYAINGSDTISVTLSTAISEGDLIIVAVGRDGGGIALSSGSDGGSNTYSIAEASDTTGGQRNVGLLYAIADTALTTSDSVTATWASSGYCGRRIDVFKVSGSWPASPLDQSAIDVPTSNPYYPFDSGDITTTVADCLLFGLNTRDNQSGTYTESTNFTNALAATSVRNGYNYAGYRIVSSTGTYAYEPTTDASGTPSATLIAAFGEDAGSVNYTESSTAIPVFTKVASHTESGSATEASTVITADTKVASHTESGSVTESTTAITADTKVASHTESTSTTESTTAITADTKVAVHTETVGGNVEEPSTAIPVFTKVASHTESGSATEANTAIPVFTTVASHTESVSLSDTSTAIPVHTKVAAHTEFVGVMLESTVVPAHTVVTTQTESGYDVSTDTGGGDPITTRGAG